MSNTETNTRLFGGISIVMWGFGVATGALAAGTFGYAWTALPGTLGMALGAYIVWSDFSE